MLLNEEATAENLRRDPTNRLARSILEHGLLGDPFLMVHNVLGGDDQIIITPWRHLKLRGAIGLDLGGRGAEETALGILAEITAVRFGGSGASMREVRASA